MHKAKFKPLVHFSVIYVISFNLELPSTAMNENGLYTLRVHLNGTTGAGLEAASRSLDEIMQWKSAIEEATTNLSQNQLKLQKEVKRLHIAKEMSDLIGYCRAVSFDINSKCAVNTPTQ